MNGDIFRQTERGLSPVVGIILMIGITVLLGATAATFFVGLSDDNLAEGPPSAKFDFDYQNPNSGSDTITIAHESGENVLAEDAYVSVEDADCIGGSDDPNGQYNLADDFEFDVDEELSADDSIQVRKDIDFDNSDELCPSGDLDFSESSLRIIWETEDSDPSTIYEWDA